MRKIIFLLMLTTLMSLSGSMELTNTHPIGIYDIMNSNLPIYPDLEYPYGNLKLGGINFDSLLAHIDSLNVRCLCLEQKVRVLEKAVEYETFKPDKSNSFPESRYGTCYNADKGVTIYDLREKDSLIRSDGMWTRVCSGWIVSPKHGNSTRFFVPDKNYNTNTITKEMNDNYDGVMEEILMLWEAIDKINRRLK